MCGVFDAICCARWCDTASEYCDGERRVIPGAADAAMNNSPRYNLVRRASRVALDRSAQSFRMSGILQGETWGCTFSDRDGWKYRSPTTARIPVQMR